ncbi:MAG: NAD(P)-binding domain-containing protein [Bacteroidota bacterium]
MKILVIGGGNMGLTYAQSFLRSKIVIKEDMMILEKSPKKAEELSKKDIGTVYGTPDECLKKADLIILAVKPQDTSVLFESLRPHIDPQQVFVSIMAGVKIETISKALGVSKVIRACPICQPRPAMG